MHESAPLEMRLGNFTVDANGCQIWNGATMLGYGKIVVDGVAKLSPVMVQIIREAVKHGASHAGVARLFGVTAGAVDHIISGRNWKSVT